MEKTFNLDVEFASQSKDFKVIPLGAWIDKTVCGCGMTSVAIESNIPTVIAMPTINLVRMKAAQYPDKEGNYPGDRCHNEVLAVYGGISRISDKEIRDYVSRVPLIKILVTYDSLPRVKFLLGEKATLVVDESNMIFSLVELKPVVIDTLLKIAEEFKKITSFISATPPPLESMPPWVSELDQIKINWSNTIRKIPIIYENENPFKFLEDYFIRPLQVNGTLTVGTRTFKKVIVFINTVKRVADIVKNCGIDKKECGIICGAGAENDAMTIGINRLDDYNNLPRYLFCSSTGFQGIDLSDPEAMTIVVSSTSKDWQRIDMNTDLKQASSRQRNKLNPNFDTYIFIYDQTSLTKSTEEYLNDLKKWKKTILTSIELRGIAKARGPEMLDVWRPVEETKDYLLIDKETDEMSMNQTRLKWDIYKITEGRTQYEKGFSVRGKIGDVTIGEKMKYCRGTIFKDAVKYFKAKNINGVMSDWGVYSVRTDWTVVIEMYYRLYKGTYEENFSRAKKRVINFEDIPEQVKEAVPEAFKEIKFYSRELIVAILQPIYIKFGMKTIATFRDLELYMDVKETKLNGVNGVRPSLRAQINHANLPANKKEYIVTEKKKLAA